RETWCTSRPTPCTACARSASTRRSTASASRSGFRARVRSTTPTTERMSPRTLTLALCELDPAAFAPFGHLPEDEGAPGDRADLESGGADPHINYTAPAGAEIAGGARGGLGDLPNRHDTHTQVLMPVDTDAFVVVAPPAVDFTKPEHLSSVRAFRVRRYQC